MAAGMQSSTTTASISPGATSCAIAAATNLKPGMGIIVDNGTLSEWKTVALTYNGGLTVTIDGTFQYNHASGVAVQWDGNATPTVS